MTTTIANTTVDAIAGLADSLRASWLRMVAPTIKPVLVDRRLRIATALSLTVAVSLALTALAPIALLALGPIVWGVPHLLADVRYLVVRSKLHRRIGVWLAIFAPIIVAAICDSGARIGAFSIVGAGMVARGASMARRTLVAAVGIALCLAAHRWPWVTDLVLAHLHNVVALALLWAFVPRDRRHLAIPFAAFAAVSIFILAGGIDGAVTTLAGWRSFAGLSLGPLLRVYAPFPEHLGFARRLLLLFAFGQSVHYAVWLRSIPDETRPQASIRSFRQTARALRRELGTVLPLLALCAAAVLAFWACIDLTAARGSYLRFASFHGHLEFALAALAWAERRAP